ncbi:MAG: hypothetical protein WBO17_12885 [Sphingorhabdus sp.]
MQKEELAQASEKSSLGRWLGWGALAGLLITPAIAMQFTDEVDWDETDFLAMGIIFALIGGAFELAVRTSGNLAYRVGFAVALLATFLLIWINLAVGIIKSEDNPANLMFAAVIATAVGGTVIARLQPRGMARAMTATAIAQALIAVVALSMGDFILILTGLFILLWLSAAALFNKAAQRDEHIF